MRKEEKILVLLRDVLEAMQKAQPKDRSENARHYAVAITMMEKLLAYFIVYVAV